MVLFLIKKIRKSFINTSSSRVVFDYKSGISASLFWDANGNLAQVNYCKLEQGRFHDWDEENRLRMVVGNKQAGYYGYDANNERVYKLRGESTLEYVDEHKTHAGVLLTDATLYPNPYIVITPKGYTKHYYANGERLATVLGQGGFGRMYSDVITHFNDTLEENLWGSSFKRYENEYPFEYLHETYPVTNPNVDIADRYIPELEYQCGEYHLSGLKLQWDKNILLYTIKAFQTVNDKETDIFYTHNNHLGSAAWITRNDGIPVQYMHYLPYGQLLANQTPTGYNERFKFIGKERDMESGYDNFGARYYIPPFIHFGSVEPLLDKYLHISPYAYCNWNPIRYVDPDGMDVWEMDETGSVVNQITDNTRDAFRMNGKEISFAKGSVTESYQDTRQTSFSFKNEDIAANAFKFLADNSPIEYGLINTNTESTIITQHNSGELSFDVADIINNGSVITSMFHSHPGNTGPSGLKDGNGDIQSLRSMEEKLGYQIVAFVYLPKSSNLWLFTGTEQGGISNFGNYYQKTGVQSNQSPSLQYRIKHILGIRPQR